MEGFKKHTFRDHQGNIILPETVSEMVRETPDRRFVDNSEKQILTRFGGKIDIVDMLITNAEPIRALATQEVALTQLIDKVPNNFEDIVLTTDELSRLVPYISQLIENLSYPPVVTSTTSGLSYALQIDDTDPNNLKLKFAQQSINTGQPLTYVKGDKWKVQPGVPDVLVELVPTHIAFDNSRKTVLVFNEGKNLVDVPEDVFTNIVNGVQEETVVAEDDNIPQAFVRFAVRHQLQELFATSKSLENTISNFTIEVLSQPMEGTTSALTQAYMNGNVVQPVREANKKEDYTANTFQNITWTNSLDTNFIREWLNDSGEAALVTYGKANNSISIAKPTLKVYIKNPYIGKTLVAQNDMDGKFNILDWAISEEE